MRKELVIAIFVGLSLGLILTFGFYTANQAIKEKKTVKTVEVVQASPSPLPALTLSIESPENNLVVEKTPLMIVGKSAPKAVIIAYHESAENFTQADEEGLFSLALPLAAGSNKITLQAINEEDKVEEKKLTIVYTTQLK